MLRARVNRVCWINRSPAAHFGVTPRMSLRIFFVQPSSAMISSFLRFVRRGCDLRESARRPAMAAGNVRAPGMPADLMPEDVLALDHIGARDGARTDDEEAGLEVLLLEVVDEIHAREPRAVVKPERA